ncbi:MAG: tRNA (adenosine(37)-N6)-dimethylallyltransferase MiaA [Spirochaetales bacterium]|uniref:tRNA dimethylallyltransferase n=1 Tax=Candidatus Thalassospirochaeta sargassi TaxID=3119039 RepID=A0AAJ1IDL7_9SPIO|nr:tRNA (adenosine(37)-N6)-dimethylallyltransferase MiaA [Spirochaetales bacterium]
MNTKSKTKTVLIFGPTAVGKTALLEAPVFHNSEIINADSMQVYRGMDIGTAKPGMDLLSKVKHHLIDIRSPEEQFHAGDFVALADELVTDINGRGKMPVICGGTGFYFKNFIYGLPDAPPSDEAVRKHLQVELDSVGPEPLRKRLAEVDPVSEARISANDNYRVLRALEVYAVSGRPLSDYELPSKPRAQYDCLLIGLNREREVLYERINRRVDIMFEQGVAEEVARLRKSGCRAGDGGRRGCREDDPGMKGIGYREFFTAENEGLSDEQLRELIKRNSRRYAKRQITWFRQLKNINWFAPDDIDGISSCVELFLGENDS